MNKPLRRSTIIALIVLFLGVLYFQTPLRPMIAQYTATRYLSAHYPDYQISDILLCGQGYHEQRVLGAYLTYTTHYSIQARATPCTKHGASCIVLLDCNGFFPFYVQRDLLCDIATGRILEG